MENGALFGSEDPAGRVPLRACCVQCGARFPFGLLETQDGERIVCEVCDSIYFTLERKAD